MQRTKIVLKPDSGIRVLVKLKYQTRAIIIIIVYYAEAAKTIQYNKAQSEYTKNYRNYRKV